MVFNIDHGLGPSCSQFDLYKSEYPQNSIDILRQIQEFQFIKRITGWLFDEYMGNCISKMKMIHDSA